MVAAGKKRVTVELLHLALLITLLRGNPRPISLYDNVNILQTNFFNDVGLDNILVDEGHHWGSSRVNYHRMGNNFMDPGIEEFKHLSGNGGGYGHTHDPFIEDYLRTAEEDEGELEEFIYRQQARLLLASQLNPAYARKDPINAFRDITAYLVSDSTTETLPPNLGGIPIASSSGGSSGSNPAGGVPSPSQSSDSGRESLSGDDGSGRHSFSESEADRNEEDLFFEESDEEHHSAENNLQETDVDAERAEPDHVLGILEQEATGQDHNSPQLNTEIDLSTIDPSEFLDFITNTWTNGSSGAIFQSESDPLPSTSGAASVADQSALGRLFDFDQLQEHEQSDGQRLAAEGQDDEMEWSLAEEEAHLEFYRSFNEVANSELLRGVPLMEIEGTYPSSQPEDEAVGAPQVNFDDLLDEAGGPIETSANPSPQLSEQEIEKAFQDWLETDSGVYDFLDSPTSLSEGRLFELDTPSSVNSVASDSSVEFDGEARSGSPSGAETEEMIQAAPIHPSGRPTSHPAQPRGFQVHARMPGLLRGGSMDQRWQELASLLSLQQGPHDGSAGPLPPSLSHPFGPHPHHHHHHLSHHHGPPPPHLHHHHHHHHFSTPPPTAPYNADSARSVLLQNATLPPPEVTSPYTNAVSMGPPNIGSAVASSMHLTNSSDPMIDPSTHYKMLEPSHDMIYYPNATSSSANAEMNNQSTEGFLSSILNDDDLQLMDMAMNEGMYTMRMLDNGVGSSGASSNGVVSGATPLPHSSQQQASQLPPNDCITMTSADDRMEASSDSAVSSMGSERVPPMTEDNEWIEPDSHPHSSHDSSPYTLDYNGTKGRGYGDYRVGTPVAQKKHHMFGKRYQAEQGSSFVLPPHHPGSSNGLPLPYPGGTAAGLLPSTSSLESLDMKYGCGVEYARHHNDLRPNGLDGVHNNHTYALPPTHADNNPLTTFKAPKPMSSSKDKQKKESLSRDEKRARGMNLPITTEDIINLPMDEFNERLSKYDLSEPQLSLIRDIRRRGKNKVAAQNCRKRKLDQILQLADEVQRIRDRKQTLLREQQELCGQRDDLKDRYQLMYRHVFQGLRDGDGNPYNIYDWSLQQAADGTIILVPKNASHASTNGVDSNVHSSRRDRSKDEYGKKTE